MTLKDNLYTIDTCDKSADTARFSIRLCAESPIYKAHFPDMPITPGVCIIGMATELLAEATGMQLTLHAIKNAKFLRPLVPDGGSTYVTISKISISEERVCSAQVTMTDSEGNAYARISIRTTAA